MKMKKLVGTLAVGALAATMLIGGTLAYLTDRDSEVNVFTVGDVSIDLNEDFVQGSELMPGVDIEKEVTIENTGKNDAYVWYTYAVPAWSDDADDASKNIIHTNLPGAFWYGYHDKQNYINSAIEAGYLPEGSTVGVVDESDTWIISDDPETIQIEGVDYNLYTVLYKGAIEPGEITNIGMNKVYLDPHVDYNKNDGKYYWVEGGVATPIEGDIADYKIYISAYGIQAEGFDTVEDAYAAYGTQWGVNGGVDYADPIVVESPADLAEALEAGETDIVVKDVTISENIFNGRYYKDRNIDFVDCTFTDNMNYMYINDASFTNCTFDCGSANSAVHYDELFGDLVFNNCTFTSGKIQIGTNAEMTGTVTFNDCTFAETASTSIWGELGIRVYSPAEFNDCEFNNRVVLAGSNGLPITFNSCTMNNGVPVNYVDNTNGIIRGGNIPDVTIND